jgi:DNA repair protein RadA/Sms
MGRVKSVYRCTGCGWESAKWLGRCGGCNAWNSLVEETTGGDDKRTFRIPTGERKAPAAPRAVPSAGSAESAGSAGSAGSAQVETLSPWVPVALDALDAGDIRRHQTGIGELDRVLGGGLVPGALILVGGDPGIGKSTLLLLALDSATRRSKRRALYVTGEESPEQVKLRADRMNASSDRVLLFAETRTDRIVRAIEECDPSAIVIDSVQAVYDPELDSAPGSVSQIREVAARFLYLAKARAVPIFLVGHVTKDGALAGPRVLEHMVDTVLYFESSTGHPYRILRAHKNRFGSTNEIGVFEMRESGLAEVSNPSELFLAERPENAPGSAVLAALEGTRPLLVEVQALVSPTSFGTPRRTCLGFDSARAALLVAVLERRAGLDLLGCDVFVNVAGGIEISEPAADLAVAAALASSHRARPIMTSTVVFGEIGLAGELRAVTQPEPRLHEAAKLGFKKAIVPTAAVKKLARAAPLEVLAVRTLEEALSLAIPE